MMNELIIRGLWLDFMVTLKFTVLVTMVILSGSRLLLNNTIYVDQRSNERIVIK